MKRCELSRGILVYLNGGGLWLSSLPALFILPPRVPPLPNQTSNPIRVSLEKKTNRFHKTTNSILFFLFSERAREEGGVYPSWILGRLVRFLPDPEGTGEPREKGKGFEYGVEIGEIGELGLVF